MDSLKLTPREMELLVAVVKETTVNVDWSKVATLANYKTSKYARDTFASIKKKLSSASPTKDGSGDGGHTDTSTPKSSAKRSAAKTNGEKATPASKSLGKRQITTDDEETPTKTKKTPANKKVKKEPLPDEDGEREEESNTAGEMLDDLFN